MRAFCFKPVAIIAASLGAAFACISCMPSAFGQVSSKDSPMDPLVHAPDFPKTFAWLNTDQPLSFKTNLKGQVVVMDFWCYCCINCMHVLPDLEYLEQKYKDQPVVIMGVHSNKYDNESDPANIRAAIQRYNIHHPVLVDEEHRVWDAYDVHSWPTFVVVGADGNIIGGISGEGRRDILDRTVERALTEAKARGTLAAEPLKLAHEGQIRAASGLSFPGKILVDAANARLFIVDSNHNRIVVTGYPGDDARVSVQTIIGSGKTGSADGDFATAEFNRPQGAALSGNTLWIADTENHLIRRADLGKKTVTTVLGTGKQEFDPEAGKSGRKQGLNSPWDVAVAGNRLYIAQAGQHQIFAMNLMTGMTEVAAGSGRENIVDGPAANANLAQPSGLALDAKNQILYFADSEVSAVRGLDLKANKVFTVIGHGLFDFGDHDGDSKTALFQHALGVALDADGKLILADTYNHKIKLVDPATRTAKTLAGNGKPGAGVGDNAVQFFEPASVASGRGGAIFVADTNNHRIMEFNPASHAWKELVIDGLASPDAPAEMVVDNDAISAGDLALKTGSDLTLKVALKLPANHHLTQGAPLSFKLTDGTKVLRSGTLAAPALENSSPVLTASIPASALAAAPRELYLMVYYTHCSEGLSAVCTPAKAAWKFNAAYSATGAAALELKP